MGKVGSSSLEFSLSKQLKERVFKLHFLSDAGIAMCEASNEKQKAKGNRQVEYGLLQMRFLRKKIEQTKAGKLNKDWRIITLTREPVSRTLSTFFQNGHLWFEDFEAKCANNEIDVDALIQDFEGREALHKQTISWFDEEIKEVLGIDVYDSSFNPKKGAKIYQNNCFELLLIRIENLKEHVSTVAHFLDIPDFQLNNYNMGSDKYYAIFYKQFKDKISFSKQYLDKIYQSKYTRNFYSEAELLKYRKKWTVRSTSEDSIK